MEISKDALSLVKSIGIPGLVEGEAPPPNKASRLLQLAELNKVPLLFLESLGKFGRHLTVEAQLSHCRSKHRKTADLITIISSLLEESGVRYAIFKTLKPFSYTPADIDVLLWSSRDLAKASKILEKRGLRPLDNDLYGLTMCSVDHDINVDLTTEVAVSSLIYLDKSLLFEHVHQVKVGGFEVQSLKPYADLVTAAAHCMYKEQMYTLSDYYTFALSSQHYQKALELAENAHAKFALETALKLTYDITINAFGSNNTLIEKLRNAIKTLSPNTIIQANKPLDIPIKYPPHVLLKGLHEKILEDPISRNSIPNAIKSTLQPRQINKLLAHITRKGY